MLPIGIEPISRDFQSHAMTTLAQAAYKAPYKNKKAKIFILGFLSYTYLSFFHDIKPGFIKKTTKFTKENPALFKVAFSLVIFLLLDFI